MAVVENYNKETVQEDLKALQERQDALANRGGRTDAELVVEEEKGTEKEDTSESNVYSSEYEAVSYTHLKYEKNGSIRTFNGSGCCIYCFKRNFRL